jgi:hypothetical protein
MNSGVFPPKGGTASNLHNQTIFRLGHSRSCNLKENNVSLLPIHQPRTRMKSAVFWDVMVGHRRFGGSYCFRLDRRRMSQVRKQQDETVRSSETSVNYRTTRHYIPENKSSSWSLPRETKISWNVQIAGPRDTNNTY